MASEISISEKITLTIQEAAKLSNIGENKLYELVKQPKCPFVIYVGKKRLIKRKEFERYLSNVVEI